MIAKHQGSTGEAGRSLVALAERVDGALEDMGDAERRALELRERGANYARIAGELGVRREAVADLLVSARLAVRAHVREGPAPPRRTQQCGPARRVMAAQQDGEAVGLGDLERLREHLEDCQDCQAARLALREAALACRAWRAPREKKGSLPSFSPAPQAVPMPAVARRRRLVALVAAALAALVVAIAALSAGGDDPGTPAAPVTQPGSADAPGRDVVPGPGETFCLDEDPDCK